MYNVQSFHISVENSKTGILLFNEKTMSLHLYWTYARKYREVYIFFIMKIRKKKWCKLCNWNKIWKIPPLKELLESFNDTSIAILKLTKTWNIDIHPLFPFFWYNSKTLLTKCQERTICFDIGVIRCIKSSLQEIKSRGMKITSL